MTALDQQIELAVAQAGQSRRGAYAPYSKFPMGAAVVTAAGEVVPGMLIENVSLGLAMCAERVALFTAVTQQLAPAVLALSSARTAGDLTFPCGACLQVALELAGPDLIVVAVDPDGDHEHTDLKSLIPRAPRRMSPERPA